MAEPDIVGTFGECLRTRRRRKRWSARQLSEITGISQSAIYGWEKDRSLPAYEYRMALRLALGVPRDADYGWWKP